MKLENKEYGFDNFAREMGKLKEDKHFDYLVTIVGEDFGPEEGLGCIYILENTTTHERMSVKQLAKQVGDDYVIPSVYHIWADSNLLEREVYDFLAGFPAGSGSGSSISSSAASSGSGLSSFFLGFSDVCFVVRFIHYPSDSRFETGAD